MTLDRRDFLHAAGAAALGSMLTGSMWTGPAQLVAQRPGDRPKRPADVKVLNPRGRVPLSLIVDDSTCLVNLNKFAMPQFAQATGDTRVYNDAWRKWPSEIPDAFVRKFADWASERGVKGKWSVVPYPACVGRLDRVLPGWTGKELTDSIDLVRKHLSSNWDFHPEMVTHTWVIDTKTGQPYPERSQKFAENWQWSAGKSADELTDYLSYALRILKNVDISCEGITTPGGFGNRSLESLSKATLAACRDVHRAEIPHYFRHLFDSGEQSVAPRVEYAADLETEDPKCAVSIIGCTGDWTGGWDCSDRGFVDRFITPDLKSGRLVDVIECGEPACLVCHWTGVYFNGEEVGLKIFDEVVQRLDRRFKNTRWMKLSEISRYWAAKELTKIEVDGRTLKLQAPFATPDFTVQWSAAGGAALPRLSYVDKGDMKTIKLDEARSDQLKDGSFCRDKDAVTACFALPKGRSQLEW